VRKIFLVLLRAAVEDERKEYISNWPAFVAVD